MNFTNVTTRRTCCWRCLCGFSGRDRPDSATVRNVRDVTTTKVAVSRASVRSSKAKADSHFRRHWSAAAHRRTVAQQVRRAVREVVQKEKLSPQNDTARRQGDILVFLPGSAEIRRCQEALSELEPLFGLDILPLHGDLSLAEQRQVVAPRPPSAPRRVILSTNLAETSLTIDGVTVVIDSGLHRQAGYAHWSGLPTLKVVPISRASATQRAGRAGRTQPGRCLRLYTKARSRSATRVRQPRNPPHGSVGTAAYCTRWGCAQAT